jgi:Fuc2NAc and GlcNAc transferase
MGEYRFASASCVVIFLLAFVGTFLIRRFAVRLKLIDLPNDRSSHREPTPRGGGIAIAVMFVAATWLLGRLGYLSQALSSVLTLGGGAVAAVGLLDDRSSLPARMRFIVHLAVAVFTVARLGGFYLAFFGVLAAWVGYFVAIVAITWAINLFNFMDGIDGLAASEAIFIAGVGAWFNMAHGGNFGVTAAFLYLASASLGFLLWNWPKASIFLGDAGSGFLGFTLAAMCLAVSLTTTIPIQVWLILSGVFLVDATITLLRRILRGDRWFEAHREHAYQRLAHRWANHLSVTLLANAINIIWLLPWALYAVSTPVHAAAISAAALGPLALLVLIVGRGKQYGRSTLS